jgi:arylsulfatase
MGRDVLMNVGKEPRLYNLDDEINEQTNLATDHPQILAELTALIEAKRLEIEENQRPAGKVENPVTLYPAEPRKKRTKKTTAKPVALESLKIGDSVSPEAAPQVGGRPFSVKCTVKSKTGSGVIVSHGGSAIGYTLYLKEGRAVFAVRHGKDVTRVTSGPLPDGLCQVRASLGKTGEISLQLNKVAPVTAKAPGLLNRQPAENFDLGFDDKNTVDDYNGKARFEGEIRDLVIQ